MFEKTPIHARMLHGRWLGQWHDVTHCGWLATLGMIVE